MGPVVDIFFGVRGSRVCCEITVTRSMGQSPAFWKREKKLGSINWTKSDYISFEALMISVDGSCSARARVSD